MCSIKLETLDTFNYFTLNWILIFFRIGLKIAFFKFEYFKSIVLTKVLQQCAIFFPIMVTLIKNPNSVWYKFKFILIMSFETMTWNLCQICRI